MFHSARLKLTAWYLTIIMVLSLMFSVAIYKVLTQEIERFERSSRFRIERRLREDLIIPDDSRLHRFPMPLPISQELIEETKHRILFMLALVNAGILISAGGFGYMLAGRTLRPIQAIVEEQHRFVSDASHELRTPITSLKSAFEVYLRQIDPRSSETRTLIKESLQEVDKLQSLSESLLQLAQYQQPNRNLPVTSLPITEIIDKAIHNVTPLAKKKHIIITNRVHDALVQGNKDSITDLLVILLDNAIKYSPDKSTVTIASEKTDGSLTLSVTDNGIGIGENDVAHIFDRFYRADSARSKLHAGGYGLGLSIAKQIVDLHHGDITIQSREHKGTTIVVRLPTRQTRHKTKSLFFS